MSGPTWLGRCLPSQATTLTSTDTPARGSAVPPCRNSFGNDAHIHEQSLSGRRASEWMVPMELMLDKFVHPSQRRLQLFDSIPPYRTRLILSNSITESAIGETVDKFEVCFESLELRVDHLLVSTRHRHWNGELPVKIMCNTHRRR